MATSRRNFIKAAGTLFAGFTIAPRHVLAQSGSAPPSGQIRIAAIGCGNMAWGDIHSLSSKGAVFTALCDVDERQAGNARGKFPNAPFFRNFWEMLDKHDKDIDAVLVATPDHTHAIAALAAIGRGKHVYCEKPLAHSVPEVRAMMAAAQKKKVITQLGNQGHADEAIRICKEWIQAGVIGNVKEIHCWIPSVYSKMGQLDKLAENHKIPGELDWELWQGIVIPKRAYNPMFLPRAWRGWSPYGTGTFGDWVCHVFDPAYWALDLGAPTSVTAEVVGDWDPKKHAMTFPKGDIIRFDFPAKGSRGPVTMRWYDGEATAKVPRPEELEADRNFSAHGNKDGKDRHPGALICGDKGKILHGSHGAGGVRVIPEATMQELRNSNALPPKTISRVQGGHHAEWLQCIRANKPAGSDFTAYGGPLTEIALIGVAALQEPGKRLMWDARRGLFTNSSAANVQMTRLRSAELMRTWARM